MKILKFEELNEGYKYYPEKSEKENGEIFIKNFQKIIIKMK
jgi:hypothetical protein